LTSVISYYSSEEFPIDFDDVWRWIEYSSKQIAEDCLDANPNKGLYFLTLGLKILASVAEWLNTFVCFTVNYGIVHYKGCLNCQSAVLPMA